MNFLNGVLTLSENMEFEPQSNSRKIVDTNMSKRQLYVDENGQLANGEYYNEHTTTRTLMDNTCHVFSTKQKGEVKNGVPVGEWTTETWDTATGMAIPVYSKYVTTYVDEQSLSDKKLEPYRTTEYYGGDDLLWRRKYAHSRTNYGIDYDCQNDICLYEYRRAVNSSSWMTKTSKVLLPKFMHTVYTYTRNDEMNAMVDINYEYDKGYEYQDAQLLSQNWTVSLTKDDFKYFTSELHKNLTKPIGEDIVIDYAEMFYDNHKKMLTIKALENDLSSALVQIFDRDGETILVKKIVAMKDFEHTGIPMLREQFWFTYDSDAEYYRKLVYDRLYILCTHNTMLASSF